MSRKPLVALSLAFACALAIFLSLAHFAPFGQGSKARSSTPSKAAMLKGEMNLLFEEGLVFDGEGKFIYRFPGVYPRFTEDGGVVMGIPSATLGAEDILGVIKLKKDGSIAFRNDVAVDHDIAVDEAGFTYVFKNYRRQKSGKQVKTARLLKIGPDGGLVASWDFQDHYEKIGKTLGRRFDFKVLEEVTGARHVLGRKVGCKGQCLEREHFNSLQILPPNMVAEKIPAFAPGNLLTGFPLNEHIVILDPNTFEILWSMKLDRIAFFHTPHLTEDGRLLLFVNSALGEKGEVLKKSSLLEIDPVLGKTVWSYALPEDLYSPINGSVAKLPNGNYLFTVVTGLAREISPDGKLVWEWKKKGPLPAGELYRLYRLNEKEKKTVINFIELGT